VGCQPIKILLRGTYHKSANENASSRQSMCIYIRLDMTVDGTFLLVPFAPPDIPSVSPYTTINQ